GGQVIGWVLNELTELFALPIQAGQFLRLRAHYQPSRVEPSLQGEEDRFERDKTHQQEENQSSQLCSSACRLNEKSGERNLRKLRARDHDEASASKEEVSCGALSGIVEGDCHAKPKGNRDSLDHPSQHV